MSRIFDISGQNNGVVDTCRHVWYRPMYCTFWMAPNLCRYSGL